MMIYRLFTNYFCICLLGFYLIGCGGSSSGSTDLSDVNQALSGGDATTDDISQNAFSLPVKGLTANQRFEFELGDSFFTNPWVEAPASTTARDGLGPYFNANSCAACHFEDGRGRPPISETEVPVSLLFRLSIKGEGFNGEPLADANYGGQLDVFALDSLEKESDVKITYEEVNGNFSDGEAYSLRKPSYEFVNSNYGNFDETLMVSPRVAPANFGMGLLEAIPEVDLLKNVDEFDSDGDGVSGKANFVYDKLSNSTKIGRLGWKANQPSIAQQVAGAFVGDMGITSSLFPDENVSTSQVAALTLENGGTPEISDKNYDAVVFYTRTLAVPRRRNADDETVLAGQKLFSQINCTACHVPSFKTGAVDDLPQLSNQIIFPYTDLLLHDMGDELADNRPDFKATGNEWRTPPLWGIGLIKTVNGHTFFLHDGRARNLQEAILWHGGEAEKSKNAFKALTPAERDKIIKFLESL